MVGARGRQCRFGTLGEITGFVTYVIIPFLGGLRTGSVDYFRSGIVETEGPGLSLEWFYEVLAEAETVRTFRASEPVWIRVLEYERMTVARFGPVMDPRLSFELVGFALTSTFSAWISRFFLCRFQIATF